MPDWTRSMQQTFEFYKVDPGTWGITEKLDFFKSGSIVRDLENETSGSASFSTTKAIGECYIRPFLVTTQYSRDNGTRSESVERFPLGTYLCQTPGTKFDGLTEDYSIEAYTPLIELKEKTVPVGYGLRAGTRILATARNIIRENMRGPVVGGTSTDELSSNFASNLDDTWITFISDLLLCGNYMLDLDNTGQVLFSPIQNVSSMQPRWIYTDDNSSILYPSISVERDLYGIPNVVEVVYSNETTNLFSRVSNQLASSPTSVPSRGRTIIYREQNPEISGIVTQSVLDTTARNILREKSSIEYKITYTHGYCPVRVGDCVLLNYKRAGLDGVRAKVIRQSIKLEPGCPVEETAVYTETLWGNS